MSMIVTSVTPIPAVTTVTPAIPTIATATRTSNVFLARTVEEATANTEITANTTQTTRYVAAPCNCHPCITATTGGIYVHARRIDILC